ncbi:hypothetical protein HYR54_12350 [Candidatus Acetothermia bacterium]|nr:hypothetical protein [Candidatus Acetothermia bacterium]MBI3459795.1 hypothetical protein [Candidatus Acetothermia bacterium]MBI3660438.1 hypothetical protein [Candidatus Acetothermia bacterium]
MRRREPYEEILKRLLNQLDLGEREREIIRLRFGLEDGQKYRLEEVAKKFNMTREQIRQIEIKALEKLKHPAHKEVLRKFRELLLSEDDDKPSLN